MDGTHDRSAVKTPHILPFCLALALAVPMRAQNIPGETVGDTGWTVYGQDTLVLVRAADANVWAQQNLGATEVASATNGANAYGDLYQWGRWNDGHALTGSATAQASTLALNNPLGLGMGSANFYIGSPPTDWWSAGTDADSWTDATVSATDGVDPCAALGIGWQLPTQADWTDVLAAEGITNTATALASNLRMPPAGARDGQTGTIINAGLYGQYWSNTVSGPYAKDLTVGDTWVNPGDDALRSYGMCVRCMNRNLHTGLAQQTSQPTSWLFPNPAQGNITVQSPSPMQLISMYGEDGRLIGQWSLRANIARLALDGLPDGLYQVRVTSADGVSRLPLMMER